MQVKFQECQTCEVIYKSVCGVCVKESDSKPPRYWTEKSEKK